MAEDSRLAAMNCHRRLCAAVMVMSGDARDGLWAPTGVLALQVRENSDSGVLANAYKVP